jgi:succinoglycan biosynthesis protein ExoW
MMPNKIAIVIPYYQEEPGILREAVMSVIAQEGVSDLEIIVVDDGSPAPARDDVRDLHLPAHVTLKLIEQPNRGPGAARNRGLDSVASDTVYVAFLDSDDMWTAHHLSNAHSMLGVGYDFYFADAICCRNRQETQFTRSLDIAQHVCVSLEENLYEFRGNAVIDLLSWRVFCHPSTVVYSYLKFPGLRFAESWWLGEDWNFWLGLIRGSSAIGFCSNTECVRGRGVNIGSTTAWDSPKYIWGLCQYMQCRKWLSEACELDKIERSCNTVQIRRLRMRFAVALLHEMRITRAFAILDVIRFITLDPVSLFYIAPALIQVVMRKVRSFASVESHIA